MVCAWEANKLQAEVTSTIAPGAPRSSAASQRWGGQIAQAPPAGSTTVSISGCQTGIAEGIRTAVITNGLVSDVFPC